MANELHEALGARHGKDLSSHKAEHKALAEQVLKFQKEFQDDKPGVAATLMPFLAEVAA